VPESPIPYFDKAILIWVPGELYAGAWATALPDEADTSNTALYLETLETQVKFCSLVLHKNAVFAGIWEESYV
jgi:hypothetical protein